MLRYAERRAGGIPNGARTVYGGSRQGWMHSVFLCIPGFRLCGFITSLNRDSALGEPARASLDQGVKANWDIFRNFVRHSCFLKLNCEDTQVHKFQRVGST